jgi:hypothetical protein
MHLSKILLLAFIGLQLICIGCASNSNFTTARAIPKGEVDGFFAVSHIGFSEDTIPILGSVPEAYFFELGANAGITEALGVGLKYTFPSAGSINGKYTYVGVGRQKGFFSAVGIQGGYTSFPTAEGDTTENQRIEFSFPLYASYFINEIIGISLIPTYSGRYYTSGGDDSDSPLSNLFGGNINLQIKSKVGVVIEGSWFYNSLYNWQEYQIGMGIIFPLKNLFTFL